MIQNGRKMRERLRNFHPLRNSSSHKLLCPQVHPCDSGYDVQTHVTRPMHRYMHRAQYPSRSRNKRKKGTYNYTARSNQRAARPQSSVSRIGEDLKQQRSESQTENEKRTAFSRSRSRNRVYHSRENVRVTRAPCRPRRLSHRGPALAVIDRARIPRCDIPGVGLSTSRLGWVRFR